MVQEYRALNISGVVLSFLQPKIIPIARFKGIKILYKK